MTMMNRCQKQLHFKLNINSVCTFSSNSKLEYFAGKLGALWELSGSSLGARRSCGCIIKSDKGKEEQELKAMGEKSRKEYTMDL